MTQAAVTLYSKKDCPLCDEAEEILLEVRREQAFLLNRVDIYSDPELYEKYKHDIPVISIDGVERFRRRVTADAVRRELRRRGPG